jgi:hypothetical protein
MIRTTWPAVVLGVLGSACSQHDIAPTPASASTPRAPALVQSLERQTKAASKPVRIVQGAFVLSNHLGSASLRGTEGFRFDPVMRDGKFPGSQCIVSTQCVPGAPVGLYGEWSGLDLSGAVVWRGKTYPPAGGRLMTLTAGFVAPPHQADAITITVPFVLNGYVQPEEFGDLLPVEGTGTATLDVVWDTSFGNGGTWAILRSRYEFNGAHGE